MRLESLYVLTAAAIKVRNFETISSSFTTLEVATKCRTMVGTPPSLFFDSGVEKRIRRTVACRRRMRNFGGKIGYTNGRMNVGTSSKQMAMSRTTSEKSVTAFCSSAFSARSGPTKVRRVVRRTVSATRSCTLIGVKASHPDS